MEYIDKAESLAALGMDDAPCHFKCRSMLAVQRGLHGSGAR